MLAIRLVWLTPALERETLSAQTGCTVLFRFTPAHAGKTRIHQHTKSVLVHPRSLAGNTSEDSQEPQKGPVHPRLRGIHGNQCSKPTDPSGSPPLRGKHGAFNQLPLPPDGSPPRWSGKHYWVHCVDRTPFGSPPLRGKH